MSLRWRVIEPCPAKHPVDGTACEGEAGHDRYHSYTVWEWSEEMQEICPSFPIFWAAVDPGEPCDVCGESRPSLAYEAHKAADFPASPSGAAPQTPAPDGGETT